MILEVFSTYDELILKMLTFRKEIHLILYT